MNNNGTILNNPLSTIAKYWDPVEFSKKNLETTISKTKTRKKISTKIFSKNKSWQKKNLDLKNLRGKVFEISSFENIFFSDMFLRFLISKFFFEISQPKNVNRISNIPAASIWRYKSMVPNSNEIINFFF